MGIPATFLDTLPSLDAVRLEMQRRQFRDQPLSFVETKLHETLWSKQRQIFEAVHQYRKVAVRSCHSSGKSFLAARIAAHWLHTNTPGDAFVVSTAPTDRQVRAILWREINIAHDKGGLIGRVNQKDWWIGKLQVGFGAKPSEHDQSAFQGLHARRVLVILDEACGIPKELVLAASTLIANAQSRMLAIGNPDDPDSEFERMCRPGSGWHTIKIAAADTPNFSGEDVPESMRELLLSPIWVEELRRSVGEQSPIWISKVLAEFPESNQDGLLASTWIRRAQDRYESVVPADDAIKELGVDVGAGGDKSVIALRHGIACRMIKETNVADTMQTTGHVIEALRETDARLAKVDVIGVGKGVVDRALELHAKVRGINVAERPNDPERFLNKRAEYWWAVRERFEQGDIAIDPDDDQLADQLRGLRYKTNSRGQIVIESKQDMKARGRASPDRADALMLACAPEGPSWDGTVTGPTRVSPWTR